MQKFNYSNESYDQLHKSCELIHVNGFINHHMMDISKLVLKRKLFPFETNEKC